MTKISINSPGGGGGSLPTGSLQLENGDAMDSTLRYVTDTVNTQSKLLLSDTTTKIEGTLTVDGGAVIPRIIIDADTNVARILSIRTNDLPRWALRVDGAESGSNAGSDFAIRRYNDAGTFIDTPVFISRSNGRVGIGTLTPSQNLDVNGDSIINGVIVGRGAGNVTTNTTVGRNALLLATGGGNTAIGETVLNNTTTGTNNTAVGREALQQNSTGSSNTAIGFSALRSNISGNNNVAIGVNALLNALGSSNVAIGPEAGRSLTTGQIVAIGLSALRLSTTGQNNTAIGFQALQSITNQNNCTAVGHNALNANTASDNSAFGFEALSANSTGFQNSAFGRTALQSNTTGSLNSALGYQALQQNTTGSNNTAIGFTSMANNITGSNNTAIGFGTSSGNFSGSVILGANATATANNQFVVGTAAINAGAVTVEVNTSSKVWNVIINGVAQKILLA